MIVVHTLPCPGGGTCGRLHGDFSIIFAGQWPARARDPPPPRVREAPPGWRPARPPLRRLPPRRAPACQSSAPSPPQAEAAALGSVQSGSWGWWTVLLPHGLGPSEGREAECLLPATWRICACCSDACSIWWLGFGFVFRSSPL